MLNENGNTYPNEVLDLLRVIEALKQGLPLVLALRVYVNEALVHLFVHLLVPRALYSPVEETGDLLALVRVHLHASLLWLKSHFDDLILCML